MAAPEWVTPRDLPTETTVIRDADYFELWNSEDDRNDFITGENLKKISNYVGDSILPADFLIPVKIAFP